MRDAVAARREALGSDMTRGMGTRRPQFALLGLTVAAIAALCSPASAQVVRGTVGELGSGTPVAHARLLLLDERLSPVASFLSDERGQFEFTAPSGLLEFSVYADAVAHKSFVEGPFAAGVDTIVLAYWLGVQPIPLDRVEVTV